VKLLLLALAFARIGIGAFGGGVSTIPLIEHELVMNYGWLTLEEFNQVLALAQVTPGPIAINAATFVGYHQAGVLGSLIATLSVASAPLLILFLVLLMMKKSSDEKVDHFKRSLRPAVGALLTLAVVPLLKTALSQWQTAALFCLGLVLFQLRIFKNNPPLLFILFGLAGLLIFQ
jgi:chromate transporter